MNQNEQILQALINDPSLIKILEKMASSRPLEQKAKKLKERGNPSYVNCVEIKCRLCGSTHTKFMMMQFDPEEKLYRTGYQGLDNHWPELPLFNMIQRSPSCASCPGILMNLSKEDLIQRLIFLSNK
jgi:hypothetical protein